MKIRVNPHTVEIVKEQTEPINELEIKVSKCEFEFDEAITSDFVKEAYFTLNGETYKQIIVNNECDYPSEVLTEKGTLEIGVVAYLVENEQEIKRYNPSPDYFESWVGSLKDAENSEPITPSDKEQIEQQLLNISTQMDNIDIEASKEEHTTTITITHKDGEEQEVQILDGEKGDKGDKGDPGQIKFIIVPTLPTQDIDESAIYLVPITPDIEGNNYKEYIYVNNQWELLGKIGVQIDLTDYVKNTDYGNATTGGVVKGTGAYSFTIDNQGRPNANTLTYEQYGSYSDNNFISKGTLENVITGKGLVSNTDYASSSVGGVIKATIGNQLQVNSSGELTSRVVAYSSYGNILENAFISKGTLDNAITGKGLVSNTDYPTTTTGGVVINNSTYGASVNSSGIIYALSRTYEQYESLPINYIISKGTLDNVLTAKIGDIQTLLDNLNTGSGVNE